jgi:hypothetical protein
MSPKVDSYLDWIALRFRASDFDFYGYERRSVGNRVVLIKP